MTFEERGNMSGKTLMLLPGTCCDWQMNFQNVIDDLAAKYHLILVNYDGFDGSDLIFPDMINVTGKIEKYIIDNHNGRIDGALGSSLGSSFVGQLIQRENIHMDPRFYPETKKVLGHYLFGYNRKTHLTHIIVSFPIAALIAWICTLFT